APAGTAEAGAAAPADVQRDRPHHEQRADRPDRQARRDRQERRERSERQGERAERQERGPRPPRPERGPQGDRAERDKYYAKPFGGGRQNKEPDPNSPFAKLAALKAQLEQKDQP